ncbi:MAG: hypothetical protein QW187_01430 [Candidatus Korarchaeum sp.]
MAVGLLVLALLASMVTAFRLYMESLEISERLSESERTLDELRRSLDGMRGRISYLEGELSSKEEELIRAGRELAALNGNLSELRRALSECMRNLSEARNLTQRNLTEEGHDCEAELSICRSRLSITERASVYLVHWWYDSLGCIPCGAAVTKFHVVLFNAGYETASNSRVVITLYDRSNVPISVFRVETGPIPGRAGKIIEHTVSLSPSFQRAEVRVEPG